LGLDAGHAVNAKLAIRVRKSIAEMGLPHPNLYANSPDAFATRARPRWRLDLG
jgi:hypothetical protein